MPEYVVRRADGTRIESGDQIFDRWENPYIFEDVEDLDTIAVSPRIYDPHVEYYSPDYFDLTVESEG